MPIRVAIADDQELVRAGLRMIIEGEQDLEVVGEAADGEQAIALAEAQDPDVILMDVRMPGMNGIEAARRIGSMDRATPTRVLMLTTFDLDEYVYEAMRAGACGFLLKDIPADDIVVAIRQAALGADSLLAPALTRRLIERFVNERARPPATTHALHELTRRETEVLTLIAKGLSNQEIAAMLHVSEATVKTHVARVFMKLELRDRVQAVVIAYESGLVRPAGSEP